MRSASVPDDCAEAGLSVARQASKATTAQHTATATLLFRKGFLQDSDGPNQIRTTARFVADIIAESEEFWGRRIDSRSFISSNDSGAVPAELFALLFRDLFE